VRDKPTLVRGQRSAFRNRTFRAKIYKSLEGRFFEHFVAVLIMANCTCFILSTEPRVNAALIDAFSTVQVVTVAIFSIEFLVRLWTIVEDPRYAQKGRLKWLTSFYCVTDFISIAPFYINELLPHKPFPPTQFVRIFRLFHIMRLEPKQHAVFKVFEDIWRQNKRLIGGCITSGVVCWLVCSALYYLAEIPPGEMKSKFESIPTSMYFTFVQLLGEVSTHVEHMLNPHAHSKPPLYALTPPCAHVIGTHTHTHSTRQSGLLRL
jgi:voltage-gated potassium channel